MGLSAEAYARQLQALLPRGSLWKLEAGGALARLLLGIGEELARVDARAVQLVAELDPSTADEQLGDWERVLGLPVDGTVLAATPADRRVAAAAAYIARGGQSEAYFYELAAACGFVVVIDDVAPSVWRMTVDLARARVAYTLTEQVFRAGASRAGDRIASLTVPELETAVLRAKPAHTACWFLYLNA